MNCIINKYTEIDNYLSIFFSRILYLCNCESECKICENDCFEQLDYNLDFLNDIEKKIYAI